MKPLSELSSEEACRLDGVVFDLDDTLLDAGMLTEDAYRALFRLREASVALIACTGRPAGWGEVIARQWPVDYVVTENGAIAFERQGDRVRRVDPCGSEERALRRRRLEDVAQTLLARHPELVLADDNDARSSDVTIDIGEYRQVPHAIVADARERALAEGVRVFVSSVHMHLTLDTFDKASGTVAILAAHGIDSSTALAKYAYVGDSENDGPAFAAFRTTFGVANIRPRAGRLSVPPRFVATRERGSGFAEIAARLVDLRQTRRS